MAPGYRASESLTDAADTFLLSNAIRDLRGDADQPRAMLVNVSRYKAVQRQVFELLSLGGRGTRTAVELHYAEPGTQHSVIGVSRAASRRNTPQPA